MRQREGRRKGVMKCEEFEAIGLERSGLGMSEVEAGLRDAAAAHAAQCPGCAALQESWQETRTALQALRETTRDAETPRRVEMQLLHEFGLRHRARKARTASIFAAWALATAAVLFAGVSWWNSRLTQTQGGAVSTGNGAKPNAPTPAVPPSDAVDEATLVADNFTLLPGSLPQEVDDSAIVRVRMQRNNVKLSATR